MTSFDWRGRKALVTGAGGFIGSHLTIGLVNAGAKVRAFVRYNSSGTWGWLDALDAEVKDAIEVLRGDVRDPDDAIKAVDGMETVFHLAALISIPHSYVSPISFVRTNVEGTLNMLTASRRAGVGRFVHTSTSEVYGTARYVPIDEVHPLQGQSPYSATKIGADMVAESFRRSFGLPVVILRPFNTYGPRQSARAIIPTLIVQAMCSDVVKVGSLHPTRDLTFVEDTAAAFIKAAEAPGAVGEVVNAGSGFDISIGDLARKIGRVLGKEVRLVQEEARIRPKEGEVERLLADNRKAKSLLAWEPSVTLDEGLERTAAWLRNNLRLYRPHDYNI